MTHTPSISFDVVVMNSNYILDSLYMEFGKNINNTNQIERDALCRWLKEECNYDFEYTFTVGDAYYLISWILFIKDIMTYLISLYKLENPEAVFMIRILGKLINTTFTFSDIIKGKFTEYLYKYIIGGKEL